MGLDAGVDGLSLVWGGGTEGEVLGRSRRNPNRLAVVLFPGNRASSIATAAVRSGIKIRALGLDPVSKG